MTKKIKLNDLLTGTKVDLAQITRIDVIPTGRSTYYNNLGGLDSFTVDSKNKAIKFLGTDAKGVETSTFKDGKDTLVARSNGKVVEYLSHLSDEPYKAQLQPFSIAIPDSGDEGTYLLLAFKEYVRTAYSDVFTGTEDGIEVTVASEYRNVASFAVDKPAITGKADNKVVVKATTILPEDALSKDINVSIDDPSVATVTKNGLEFTFHLIKGNTKAHFVAADGGSAKVDATITVS